MATIAVFTPLSAAFPSTNMAPLTLVNGRPVLAYDAGTDESANWTIVANSGLTTPLTAVINFMMASATTGNVIIDVSLEAVTAGDTLDLDSATSFDAVNASAATAVPGTAGFLGQISITLTNADGIAPGDYVRYRVTRDADNAGDTAAGDLYLLAVEIRDST